MDLDMDMDMDMDMDSSNCAENEKGFTLLELSIVLVIIGLIIGGITAGQDLIRAAELNSIISDVNKYKVTLNTFKLKYNAIPGDMTNADSYWPACVADSEGNLCNGNGDGDMDGLEIEGARAWEHMNRAELLSGNHTPTWNADPCPIDPTFPDAPIGNGKYYLTNWSAPFASNVAIILSAPDCEAFQPITGFLESEAHSIDRKIDDGIGNTGRVGMTVGGAGSDYDLSSSNNTDMIFKVEEQ